MKKLTAFLPVLAMLFLAAFSFLSCVELEKTCPPETNEKIESDLVYNTEPVHFNVQYIRTDGYHENIKYPAVKVVCSDRELNMYYESNKELYSLERRENPASDSTIGFLDACDRYDEAYFEDHILLMVILEEGSGSNRHEVKKVLRSKDWVTVEIDTIVPEVGTCDMAEWHILVELPREAEMREENITIFLDGVDPLKADIPVRHSEGYANISLNLPYDWKYELIYSDYENVIEKSFCIAISPKEETEGKLRIWCNSAFGFCGTGLKQEKIKLGKYEAYRGTYEGDKLWYFIDFCGLAGSYQVINDGAEAWWDDYGEKAMEILETLTLAENIITEAEAIRIAKESTDATFDTARTSFSSESGIWTVTLSNENGKGDICVCNITSEGKILDIAIGDGKENE